MTISQHRPTGAGRRRRLWRYVLVHGLLGFGLPYAAAMWSLFSLAAAAERLAADGSLAAVIRDGRFVVLLFSIPGGIGFGVLLWHISLSAAPPLRGGPSDP